MGGSVYSKDTETKVEFKKYMRLVLTEARPYVLGELLPDTVTIFPLDRASGSPAEGDMIARNELDHDEQWLVSKNEFMKTFSKVDETATPAPAEPKPAA
jgi:hypothetical protein